MMKRITILTLVLLAWSGVAQAWQVSNYNFEKGETFIVNSEVNVDIIQSVMGQEQNITQEITSSEKLEVVEVNGSEFTLSSTNISTHLTVSFPGGTQVIDSEGDSEADGTFKVLVGKTYQFTISETGKVLSISGLQEIKDAISAELEGSSLGPSAPQILDSFSEENIRTQLEKQFSIYPEDGSESWEQSMESVINGLPVTITSQFKYNSDDVISVNSDLNIEGKISNMGMEMDAALSGKEFGTLTLDEKSGICTKLESSQMMEGTITAQGMAIPMSLSVDTKIIVAKQ